MSINVPNFQAKQHPFVFLTLPWKKLSSSLPLLRMVNSLDGKVLKLETWKKKKLETYKGRQEIKTTSVPWFVMTSSSRVLSLERGFFFFLLIFNSICCYCVFLSRRTLQRSKLGLSLNHLLYGRNKWLQSQRAEGIQSLSELVHFKTEELESQTPGGPRTYLLYLL